MAEPEVKKVTQFKPKQRSETPRKRPKVQAVTKPKLKKKKGGEI
jgi:hypothetical protein